MACRFFCGNPDAINDRTEVNNNDEASQLSQDIFVRAESSGPTSFICPHYPLIGIPDTGLRRDGKPFRFRRRNNNDDDDETRRYRCHCTTKGKKLEVNDDWFMTHLVPPLIYLERIRMFNNPSQRPGGRWWWPDRLLKKPWGELGGIFSWTLASVRRRVGKKSRRVRQKRTSTASSSDFFFFLTA